MASTGTNSREAVVGRLKAAHTGEEIIYTGCVINCGSGCCLLKVRRKDGKITAIEPDDHYNRGVAREDEVLTDEDFMKNRLQLRGCPMAWMFHKLAYSPDRILYPLKRVEGSKRMEGRYERISWDEALDLVASKMEEMVEKYGPYSITTAYQPSPHLERLFGLWGAGVEGWGWCSKDPARLAMHLMAGVPGWSYNQTSNDAADVLLNSKLIVLWGFEPTITHFGPGHQLAYYLRIARERGTPVICIEPRYTVAAEVLADQWIPIKPGTDAAMMLAIGYVLFTENLYDHEYVEKYVDLRGVEEWRSYIVGEKDGIAKTPEWAEKICGVPAETIRGFTHLYAKTKPTWLWLGWGPPRKSRGENAVRAAAALQAITGNWGVAGGSVPFDMGTWQMPARMLPYGEIPNVRVPKMYRCHKWAQMVLLRDKVESGEVTVEEYKRIIGWRAPNHLPLPNPKMLMGGGGWMHNTRTLINAADSTNDHVKAADRMEFIVWIHSHMSPALWISDVILPVAEQTLEDRRIWGGGNPGYGGFANITYVPGVIEPPGEAKPGNWIHTEIARRLGIGELYNTFCSEDGDWWDGWEKYLKHEYDRVTAEVMSAKGVNPPEWEDFKKNGLINAQELYEKPYHAYTTFIDEGQPLLTKTGKLELYSYVIGDESQRGKLHVDDFDRLIDCLPNDWRDLPPIPAYQPMYRGMDHSDVRRFPLFLLSAYPRYRNHTVFWNVPWLRGDCYRHAVWINVADAQTRGIRDGDKVRVFNDKGVAVIPAYVTSRILPGMIVIHHGGNYEPDKDGVDWGCTPNIFFTDPESPVTAPPVSNLVQAERFGGAGP